MPATHIVNLSSCRAVELHYEVIENLPTLCESQQLLRGGVFLGQLPASWLLVS